MDEYTKGLYGGFIVYWRVSRVKWGGISTAPTSFRNEGFKKLAQRFSLLFLGNGVSRKIWTRRFVYLIVFVFVSSF